LLLEKCINAFTDEYDLVLLFEGNFELGIRFSENENTMYYIANIYFTLFDNGKWRKFHKVIDGAILSEVNIKRTIRSLTKLTKVKIFNAARITGIGSLENGV
jgi:hypothetical protein